MGVAAKMHFAFVLPFALVAAASGAVVPAVGSHNAPTSSQFHSQDEAGNFAFGSNPVSHREESGNVETGVVRGSYTNAWGRTIHYVADNFGFRATVDTWNLLCYHHWISEQH